MKLRFQNLVRPLLLAAVLPTGVLLAAPESIAAKAEPPVRSTNQYWSDARVFSVVPDQAIASYQSYSGGGVGPAGTLTLGVSGERREFDVSIEGKVRDGKFLATVTVEPDDEDLQTRAQVIEYDLTDLAARSVELARDADGRIYRLSLMPTIVEVNKPRQFKVSNLSLDFFSFSNSPIILNDQDYLGSLSMSSGPLAWCDIPGLARIEFSLLPLKDARPIGTLREGVIKIEHEDGQSLEIAAVKNGANHETLAGGPYKVWVRWQPPTQTIEEHHAAVKKQIAVLRQQVKDGEISLPQGMLERMEKRNEAGGIGLISSGLRGVSPDELAESAQ
jgi:hypothetical protein